MRKHRTNKLYNYLVNTYGLSHEMIMDYVSERLNQLVEKHIRSIFEENRIEDMIVHTVTKYMKEGEKNGPFYGHPKTCFEDIVKKQIKDIIEELLRDKCEIKFKFNSNSVRFIKDKE